MACAGRRFAGSRCRLPCVTPEQSEQARWFAAEVLPHESDLRAYLRRNFPSLRDVDDLVQETYARIFRARRAGQLAETRPYLFSTARNAACDLLRRSRIISFRRFADTDRSSVVEDRPGVADALAQSQEIEILQQAIARLPTRCRQVFTLCKLYGLSHREVAAQLGISEHTVNAQIAIGLLRCRDYLRARGLMNHDAGER